MSAYSFTKLFSSITESTIWCEPSGTRLVWITLLAKCDRHGRMQAAVPGLARLANVTLAECEAALQTLLEPDPYSRTPDNDGRRIEVIDGGWRLLNHAKYRDMRDDEVRREQNREAQARHRERESAKNADSKQDVSDTPGESANSSAHADADASTEKAKATGQQAAQAPAFVQFWNAYPLKKGRAAAMKAWPKAIAKTTLDALLAALKAQVANDDEWRRGYVPRASTYLNGEFWNDEIAKPKPDMRAGPAVNTAVPRGKPAEAAESALEAAIQRARHLRSMDVIDDDALQLEIQRVTRLHRGEPADA